MIDTQTVACCCRIASADPGLPRTAQHACNNATKQSQNRIASAYNRLEVCMAAALHTCMTHHVHHQSTISVCHPDWLHAGSTVDKYDANLQDIKRKRTGRHWALAKHQQRHTCTLCTAKNTSMYCTVQTWSKNHQVAWQQFAIS